MAEQSGVMLYYIVPWLIWLSYCLYWNFRRERPSSIQSLIAFLPLVVVACVRGNVGTDTYTYLTEVDLKLQDLDRPLGEFEPGFELVIGLLGDIFRNARAVVLALAFINAALFYVSLKKWGGCRLVGAALLVPAFFFDYAMNGLRMGMAVPLCVLAYVALENRRPGYGLALAAAAVSVQMTSLVLLGLLMAYKVPFRLSVRRVALVVVTLVGFGVLFSSVFSERVLAKVALYELSSAPSAVSGLAPLLFSAILALPFLDNVKSRAFRASVLLFVLQLGFFMLSSLTYAGLRFQLLCLFAQALVVQRELVPKRFVRSTRVACCIVFFVFCLSWEVRNFGNEQGIGESPYLPYEFFWQANDPA
jgi:hypothetical protein